MAIKARDSVVPFNDESAWDGNVREMLQLLGEDPDREGLLDTPRRVREAWREWCSGYQADVVSLIRTFACESAANDLVCATNIPVYSQCEHHLVPFFGVAHIGYLPSGRVLGLSKLARLVRTFSARLQMQERLTAQVAEAVFDHLAPGGVAAVLTCRHLCMEARGVRAQGTCTTTYAFRGSLADESSGWRREFLASVHAAAPMTP